VIRRHTLSFDHLDFAWLRRSAPAYCDGASVQVGQVAFETKKRLDMPISRFAHFLPAFSTVVVATFRDVVRIDAPGAEPSEQMYVSCHSPPQQRV
jgi:hypothetical protein